MLFEKSRRSESEVIYDILTYAKTQLKKTRLMYLSNMPYNHFNKYLDLLLEKELIEKIETNPEGSLYFTTEKGNNYLQSMDYIFKLLKN